MVISFNSLIKSAALNSTAVILVLYLIVGIIGCGGGSDEPAYTPLPDQDANGIWDGLYINTEQAFFPIKAIIYRNHWVLFDEATLYDPIDYGWVLQSDNVVISSNEFHGDFIKYTWESYSYTALFDGEVYTKDSIYGVNNVNRHISFRLDDYLSVSDDGASLLLLEGNWSYARGTSFSLDVSMDQFGSLTGVDSEGCFYNGNVTVPEPARNIYLLKVTKSSCDAKNGEYSGLGYVWGASFTYTISNSEYSMVGRLVKN